MENKIKNLEQHVEFMYEELENKEQEIDNLKKSLDEIQDKCRQKSTSAKCDQDEIEELKKVTEEQRIKIYCLRKHRDDILDRHEKVLDDYEVEFKAKENDIKILQELSKGQEKELYDVKEELGNKLLEIEDLKVSVQKKDLKTSSSSLLDEMKVANLEAERKQLDTENKYIKCKVQKLENAKIERSGYFTKMEEISVSMSKELENLKSSVILLSKAQEKQKCLLAWNRNQIFCTKDHTFLYRKISKENLTPVLEQDKGKLPQETDFKCKDCGLKVARLSQLDVHRRLKHEDVANFECGHCPFKCNRKNKLKEHVQSKHEVFCRKCKKAFNSIQALEKHKQKHTMQQKVVEKVPKHQSKIKSRKKISKPKEEFKCNKKGMKRLDKEEEVPSDDESLESSPSEVSLTSSQESPGFESSSEEKTETGEDDELSQTGGMSEY